VHTKTFFGVLFVLPALAAAPAAAQMTVDLEGTITAINATSQGSIMTVMGIDVLIPSGTPITSPTANLSLSQLMGSALPGRTVAGFLGGTAIISGFSGSSVSGVEATATSVFVEPAENVVIGPLGAGSASILGTPLELLTDARVPGMAINAYGFTINPAVVPAGTLAGVEGYFASGKLYAHTLEVDAPIPPAVNPNLPQVSVLRVSCEPGGRLEVRGGGYLPSGRINNTVTVRYNNGVNRSGTATAIVDDLAAPNFGLYRFRADVNRCPSTVTVTMNYAGGVTAPVVADVP
jgi:hypothetical protein